MIRFFTFTLIFFVINYIVAQKSDHHIITGTVKDSLGEPIIGAHIQVKGTKLGTVADIDGLYILEVPKSAKILHFSSVHFKSINIPIGTNDTINAVLKWHGRPEPIIGFEEMERYIQKNLRYPKAAKKSKVEGKVVVEFTLRNQGGSWLFKRINRDTAMIYLTNVPLYDFKIIQSLGYGCDEEAMRLLQEGPAWDLRNKVLQSDTATYTIEFKLKK